MHSFLMASHPSCESSWGALPKAIYRHPKKKLRDLCQVGNFSSFPLVEGDGKSEICLFFWGTFGGEGEIGFKLLR